jgi:4-amino-4-deoxy-L-arabinose transferase-like glycosyltransferase
LKMRMPFSRRELLLLALIIVVAGCLRLYRLQELPPGLSGDTAYKGVAADRVLGGEYPIFFEESWGGIEPMYIYLQAGFFKLFGSTPLAIKALSALIGTITIPVFYLLIRELLHSTTIALLASSWLAVSYWHIGYSRLGWEIILAPLFVVVTIYFLWRGLSTNRRRDFILAGLALGASLYTYQAMRFLPILVIAYLVYRTLVEKGFGREYWPHAVLCLLVAVLVFAPLGTYFVTHSDAFLRRAGEVSIFNPEKNPQGPLYSFVLSTLRVLGTYNLRGDPLWRHNLPGRPAFDILTSGFFLVGLAVSVFRWRDRAYSLFLLWLVILSLPPILTPPRDVPHFSRSIGALPAACVFPAIGIDAVCRWVRTRRPRRQGWVLTGCCLIAVLVTSATLVLRDYFVVWAAFPGLRDHYFDGQFVDLAAAMNELDDPDGVWLLPISAMASPHDEPGHHTVEFLYRGVAPFHFLRLDEATIADELSTLTRGRTKVLLVDYKEYVLEEAYNFIDADPKKLAPFLLLKYGEQLEHHEFDSFDVRIYSLPPQVDFAIAPSLDPASANFDGQLALTAQDFGVLGTANPLGRELPSGGEAWVALKWRALANPATDYKVAVTLLDQRDRVVGQVDKPLLSNDLRLTSEWARGQEEMDYYVLPNLPATPPGEYRIKIAVYDPSTMAGLPLKDEDGNVLGHSHTMATLQIVRSASPPLVRPTQKVEDGTLLPGLTLVGFDLPVPQVNPGDGMEVALYWRAERDLDRDYVVLIQLRDAQGIVWGHEESRPAYGTYPTSQWEKGEVVRDWHDLPVPADTPSGEYELSLALLAEGQLAGELNLGTVYVSGRARSFAVPPMEHKLGWMLGDAVRLLGYDIDGATRSGETLGLTLYWQCVAEMATPYTVFTHLLDGDNVIRGQVDSPPAAGAAPTTSWVQGEVITDTYQIPVDSDSPAGQYVVEIGMYDPSTMERLPVHDAQGAIQGDRILLETVHIEP